ncbi:urotensin 1 [Sebastes fasciatus]|uniref:urotensin 1 n=1 Tax=Sebastes fasciatus TaxID=394691 RepID=UPI003D9F868A
MKLVLLLLLLSSVLRSAAGRPRVLSGWMDGSGLQTQHLDQELLRGDGTTPELLLDHILRRFLQEIHLDQELLSARHGTTSELLLDHILRRFLQERHPEPRHLLPEPLHMKLPKRSEEPPLSIDLTFHLLRNMIQIAKMESQREQAQLNRKVLDEVGK